MYQISPTFLDSFAYYIAKEDGEQERAELLARLRGEPTEISESMQRGIDFETAVGKFRDGTYEMVPGQESYDSCVMEISRLVAGGIPQMHVERELGGVLVHGYIDFLNANWIYDIKTTKSYEVGKYLQRNQHLAYLYCLEPCDIRHFGYLVTDFRNVYAEDYHWHPSFTDRLRGNIAAFFDYLEVDKEMREAFEAKNA